MLKCFQENPETIVDKIITDLFLNIHARMPAEGILCIYYNIL